MKILLACSKKVQKILGEQFDDFNYFDESLPAKLMLHSDEQVQMWQLAVTERMQQDAGQTFIAVESRSRFTILISTHRFMTKKQFEQEFQTRFTMNVLSVIFAREAVHEGNLGVISQQIKQDQLQFHWKNFVDPSVNAHAIEAEDFLVSASEGKLAQALTEDEEMELGMHLNNQIKDITQPCQAIGRFSAIDRFMHDGLFRFAKGLSEQNFPFETPGDFPNPFAYDRGDHNKVKSQVTQGETVKTEGNVISLKDEKARRMRQQSSD